jgi:arylsulfatase A-like enzyme
MVAGPGITAGTYSEVPVIGYDFLPTFADLVSSKMDLPKELEGGSFKSVLMNEGVGEVSRERDGLYFSRQLNAVVIQHPYKLILTHRSGDTELYDVSADLSEQQELSNDHPDVAKAMLADLQRWMEDNDVLTASEHAPRGRRRANGP